MGNSSLKVDVANKGYTGGPHESDRLYHKQYQGAATKYE